MPSNRKTIAKGKPDGRKNNRPTAELKEKLEKTKFVKGDPRLVGDANPNRKKVDGRKNNGKHLPIVGKDHQFKEGHTPRNKLLKTILKEKGFSREAINDIFAGILTANPEEIIKMKVDSDITMLELIGISGVEAAMRTADFGRMDYLLGQIFGKQPQRTENVNYNMNVDSQTTESDRERIDRILASKFGQ